MGGCASVSLKNGAKAGFLPPEPAKEAAATTEPAVEKAKGDEQEEKMEVVEDNKGRPSLGALLDEDAASKSKNEEISTSTPSSPLKTKLETVEETEKKSEEKKNN